jgi:hypothetical protein
MKKMSQILESTDNSKWEVKIQLSLFVDAANEGEASFLAEQAINSLQLEKELTISDVEKI